MLWRSHRLRCCSHPAQSMSSRARLLGGFAPTPSCRRRDRRSVSFTLMLNVGLAWVASRKKWPGVMVLTLALTAVYQWGWVFKFLSASQLPLAMGIFLIFGIAAFAALTIGGDGDTPLDVALERTGLGASAMPLVFAITWPQCRTRRAGGAALRVLLLLDGECWRCRRAEGRGPPAPRRRRRRHRARLRNLAGGVVREQRVDDGHAVHGGVRDVLRARADAGVRDRPAVRRSGREGGVCRADPVVRVPGDRAHRAGRRRPAHPLRIDVRVAGADCLAIPGEGGYG